MTKLVLTEGIVLAKKGMGEANSVATILTESLGLVYASARSARSEKSKLRYGLEPLTIARFSLVRGKREWKITGVDVHARDIAAAPIESRAAAGRIAKLLTRLIHGEERVPGLCKGVCDGVALLGGARSRDERESVECVLVLRILFALGYVPRTPELAPFIQEESLSLDLAAQAAARRSALIRAINESLLATGL